MIFVGLLLMGAGIADGTTSPGMPTGRPKPQYPMSRRVRVVLFVLGIGATVLGVLGWLRT